MKNITLSADENLIEQARLVAQAQHKTLNVAFREWLEQYAARLEAVLRWTRSCAVCGMCGHPGLTPGMR